MCVPLLAPGVGNTFYLTLYALPLHALSLLQIISGLHHMHSRGLMHGDVKSENVTLSVDPTTGLAKAVLTDVDGAQPVDAHGCPVKQ